jgi:hypothetical protein
MSNDEYQDTVEAINSYHLRRRQEGHGLRSRWAEIKTNLIRGLRGGKDGPSDDEVYITAQRPPLRLLDFRESADSDET